MFSPAVHGLFTALIACAITCNHVKGVERDGRARQIPSHVSFVAAGPRIPLMGWQQGEIVARQFVQHLHSKQLATDQC